jgi:ribonucleotide reductase beta subunit family protein with ferritin-like domain
MDFILKKFGDSFCRGTEHKEVMNLDISEVFHKQIDKHIKDRILFKKHGISILEGLYIDSGFKKRATHVEFGHAHIQMDR